MGIMNCGCSNKKMLLGGKKSSPQKKKQMKGGKETEGATGMPSQFYNAKMPSKVSSDSGVSGNDTAVANLAPYNKTGGAKKPVKKTVAKKPVKKTVAKKPVKKTTTKKP